MALGVSLGFPQGLGLYWRVQMNFSSPKSVFPGSDLSSLRGPGVKAVSLDQPHWNVPQPAHLRPDSLNSPISAQLGHHRGVLHTPGRFCHPLVLSCCGLGHGCCVISGEQGASALLALQGKASLPASSSSPGRGECGPVTCGAAPTAADPLHFCRPSGGKTTPRSFSRK